MEADDDSPAHEVEPTLYSEDDWFWCGTEAIDHIFDDPGVWTNGLTIYLARGDKGLNGYLRARTHLIDYLKREIPKAKREQEKNK
jgi:hypothetical protein